MHPVTHAVTALLVRRWLPGTNLPALLVAVQLPDLLWVGFAFAGFESTSFAGGAVQLRYRPLSNSMAGIVIWTAVSWLVIVLVLRRRALARAFAVAVASNLVINPMTHFPEVPLVPRGLDVVLGLGIHRLPLLGSAFEFAYGVLCWRVVGGGWLLLATVVAFNLVHAPGLPAAAGRFTGVGFAGVEGLLGALYVAVELLLVSYFVHRYAPPVRPAGGPVGSSSAGAESAKL